MWAGFELLESGLGIDMASIVTIVVSLFLFIFSARHIILPLLFGVVLYPLCAVWFYEMQWQYQTPLALTILCLISLALIINTKASGESII